MLLLSAGDIQAASSVSINEIKISICQVCNEMLKTEHFQINEKMGEKIPNGAILGLYEDIPVLISNGKSKATLPVKPQKLPRNMGIYAIYPKYTLDGNYEYDKEFIPLQMGQFGLLQSQKLLNDLMGQVGYENYGMELMFTKNIKSYYPDVVLAMRLAIMDFSLYGDYDPLPILPEMEWQVKKEVLALYSKEPLTDLLIDDTSKQQQNVPVKDQKQTS